MKKNAKIHLPISTEALEKLKREAEQAEVSLAELCRQKLQENTQLNRIENMLKDRNY